MLGFVVEVNARALGGCDGTLDEFDSESSESVDDEVGTLAVRDVLKAGDGKGTPAVRRQ